MNRPVAPLVTVCLIGVTTALAVIGHATQSTPDRPSGEPRGDSALVYFIRQGALRGGMISVRIFCDDRLVAVVPNGNYAFAHVPSGTHLVWVRGMGDRRPFPFDFASGQTHYMVFKNEALSLVSRAEGLAAIAKAQAYRALGDKDRRQGEETVARDWPELRDKYGVVLAQSDSVGYVPPASTEGMVKVPAGTCIRAELRENLSSEFNKPGDPVWMLVADSVQIDGAVLVNKGTVLRATIRGAEGSSSNGRGGRLDLTAVSVVAADGTVCPLIGQAASGAGTSVPTGVYMVGGAVGGLVGGMALGGFSHGHAVVHAAGHMVDVFTRKEIWISPGSSWPVESAVPPARDPMLYIRCFDHVAFDLVNSQFPITVKFTVNGAQSVTAAELVAVDGACIPEPLSAQYVSESSEGFDAVFAGWDICRYVSVRAINVTLTLRITGSDGSYRYGDVTIRPAKDLYH